MSAVRIGVRDNTPAVGLSARDMIEVGVSHQLKINGDESWISYKISTRVGEGESADHAHQRALNFLSAKVEEAVARTVADVERMSK